MNFRSTTAIALVLALLTTPAAAQEKASPPAANAKKVIQNASDMPPLVLELPKKPSALVVEGGAGFDAVRDQVVAHVLKIL